MKHPMQPIVDGRFKVNKIVDFLADNYGLNELAVMDFSREDWVQFAQLQGYSLGGFGSLSYVRDEDYDAAVLMDESEEITSLQAENQVLREKLFTIRSQLKDMAVSMFGKHPDDFD